MNGKKPENKTNKRMKRAEANVVLGAIQSATTHLQRGLYGYSTCKSTSLKLLQNLSNGFCIIYEDVKKKKPLPISSHKKLK